MTAQIIQFHKARKKTLLNESNSAQIRLAMALTVIREWRGGRWEMNADDMASYVEQMIEEASDKFADILSPYIAAAQRAGK